MAIAPVVGAWSAALEEEGIGDMLDGLQGALEEEEADARRLEEEAAVQQQQEDELLAQIQTEEARQAATRTALTKMSVIAYYQQGAVVWGVLSATPDNSATHASGYTLDAAVGPLGTTQDMFTTKNVKLATTLRPQMCQIKNILLVQSGVDIEVKDHVNHAVYGKGTTYMVRLPAELQGEAALAHHAMLQRRRNTPFSHAPAYRNI
eukprot:SAG11_NODE_109_length_16381_cov_48.316546_11_plen_206_part_00